MVEKSGVERSGVEAWGLKSPGLRCLSTKYLAYAYFGLISSLLRLHTAEIKNDPNILQTMDT